MNKNRVRAHSTRDLRSQERNIQHERQSLEEERGVWDRKVNQGVPLKEIPGGGAHTKGRDTIFGRKPEDLSGYDRHFTRKRNIFLIGGGLALAAGTIGAMVGVSLNDHGLVSNHMIVEDGFSHPLSLASTGSGTSIPGGQTVLSRLFEKAGDVAVGILDEFGPKKAYGAEIMPQSQRVDPVRFFNENLPQDTTWKINNEPKERTVSFIYKDKVAEFVPLEEFTKLRTEKEWQNRMQRANTALRQRYDSYMKRTNLKEQGPPQDRIDFFNKNVTAGTKWRTERMNEKDFLIFVHKGTVAELVPLDEFTALASERQWKDKMQGVNEGLKKRYEDEMRKKLQPSNRQVEPQVSQIQSTLQRIEFTQETRDYLDNCKEFVDKKYIGSFVVEQRGIDHLRSLIDHPAQPESKRLKVEKVDYVHKFIQKLDGLDFPIELKYEFGLTLDGNDTWLVAQAFQDRTKPEEFKMRFVRLGEDGRPDYRTTAHFLSKKSHRPDSKGLVSLLEEAERDRFSEKHDLAEVRNFNLPKGVPIGYICIEDSNEFAVDIDDAQENRRLPEVLRGCGYDMVCGKEKVTVVQGNPQEVLKAKVDELHSQGVRHFFFQTGAHGNGSGIYFPGKDSLGMLTFDEALKPFKDVDAQLAFFNISACLTGGYADKMPEYKDDFDAPDGRFKMVFQTKPSGLSFGVGFTKILCGLLGKVIDKDPDMPRNIGQALLRADEIQEIQEHQDAQFHKSRPGANSLKTAMISGKGTDMNT